MKPLQIYDPLAISQAMRQKLEGIAQVMSFREGDVLLDEHANIRTIPLVISGSIRVMRTDEEGREILLYYIRPGESCIMSFLGGVIPISQVQLLLKENSDWTDYVFRLYHKRFEELLDVVDALAFKHIDVRILTYLEEKAALAGSRELSVTHQHIADDLGTARVVVSRILKQMETNGLVQLGRNKIRLV